MITIINPTFIISATDIKNSPQFGVSEIAFIGRSNVGKSAFINALVNSKNLAKSSQTPGKTQLINFFDITFKKQNEEKSEESKVVFVDLPGYGYAKVAKKLQNIWQKNLDEFLKNRINIKLFVHLVDSRHFDLEIDKDVDSYLKSFLRKDQKILRIYTKADKINQSQRAALFKFDPLAKLVSTQKPRSVQDAREALFLGVLGKC